MFRKTRPDPAIHLPYQIGCDTEPADVGLRGQIPAIRQIQPATHADERIDPVPGAGHLAGNRLPQPVLDRRRQTPLGPCKGRLGTTLGTRGARRQLRLHIIPDGSIEPTTARHPFRDPGVANRKLPHAGQCTPIAAAQTVRQRLPDTRRDAARITLHPPADFLADAVHGDLAQRRRRVPDTRVIQMQRQVRADSHVARPGKHIEKPLPAFQHAIEKRRLDRRLLLRQCDGVQNRIRRRRPHRQFHVGAVHPESPAVLLHLHDHHCRHVEILHDIQKRDIGRRGIAADTHRSLDARRPAIRCQGHLPRVHRRSADVGRGRSRRLAAGAGGRSLHEQRQGENEGMCELHGFVREMSGRIGHQYGRAGTTGTPLTMVQRV